MNGDWMAGKLRKPRTITGAYKAVTVLEAVLSFVFIPLSYATGDLYIKGVGVGLLISWVTGALAYLIVSRRNRTGGKR